jgi:hypothetical protein
MQALPDCAFDPELVVTNEEGRWSGKDCVEAVFYPEGHIATESAPNFC